MRSRYIFSLLALALLTVIASVYAQDLPPRNSAPTITFDRVWEAITPQSINFTVQQTGSVLYLSRNPFNVPDNRAADPDYTLDFTLSSGNLEKIFRDAREANYF